MCVPWSGALETKRLYSVPFTIVHIQPLDVLAVEATLALCHDRSRQP